MPEQIEPQPKESCPLCGACGETRRAQGLGDPPHFFVQCINAGMCGARGPGRGDPGSAVATWDKRTSRTKLPADVEWIPVEQAPNRWMRALVKLKDGTITLAVRREYYSWHWVTAVTTNSDARPIDSGGDDDIVAFWPLPEKEPQ